MRFFSIEKYILFEDSEILVLKKPAGIAVQNAGFGSMDLESAIKNYLAAKNPGKMPYLGVIHRLDQPVEGVLVFAKNASAAKELSRQLNAKEFGKYYYAVIEHIPQKTEQILEDYLLKEKGKNISKVVTEKTPDAKKARLSYKVLEEAEDAALESEHKYLLKIKLDTGRHHQIRVQMSHAGMPLIGDRKYNSEDKSQYPLALCSCQLELVHPKKKKMMKFEIVPEGAAFRGFCSFREK